MRDDLVKEMQASHHSRMQCPHHIELRTLLELWTAVESTNPNGEIKAKIISQTFEEDHHYEIEISAYSEIQPYQCPQKLISNNYKKCLKVK